MKIKDSNCAFFYLRPPVWFDAGTQQAPDFNQADFKLYSTTISCGVTISVTKQGGFHFDFSGWVDGAIRGAYDSVTSMKWEPKIFARMRFMNLVLVCFYSALYTSGKVAGEKLFIDYSTYTSTGSMDELLYLRNSNYKQPYFEELANVMLPELAIVVSLDVLVEGMAIVESAFNADPVNSLQLPEMLLHAFYLHGNGKYEVSLTSCWAIIEKGLNTLWDTYLKESNEKANADLTGEQFINANRRQKLTGRDFTASVISEILSLSGVIPFDEYKEISNIRVKRNNWLHSLAPIQIIDSANAITTAQKMLRRSTPLLVHVPFPLIGRYPLSVSIEQVNHDS